MIASELYKHLEDDFMKPEFSDDWFQYMSELEAYIFDDFKIKNMGLLCDFTEIVNNVYTAVFPSENVLKNIIGKGGQAMLFVHHASIWDLKKSSNGFYNMDISLLENLKEKQISIFCYHVPLDNFSEYSTSKTLADALGIEIIKPFIEYNGGICGIIGKTKYKTVNELQKKYSEVVGHETKIYQYGNNEIENNIVGICAGGGNDIFVVEELIKNNINTLITGISLKNDFSAKIHEFEQNNKINIIGGTHYSSEKFACMAMCKYFLKFGLSAEFIEDEPCLEDM